jgi:hypothetical protein
VKSNALIPAGIGPTEEYISIPIRGRVAKLVPHPYSCPAPGHGFLILQSRHISIATRGLKATASSVYGTNTFKQKCKHPPSARGAIASNLIRK